jgi:anti-sigma B factor antagonist
MSDRFEALRLFIVHTGSIARLEIGGELDLATVGTLRDHLDLLVESGTGDVEVDMARVTFCDASGLSVIVAAHHGLAEVGRRMRIVAASSRVLRLLQLTALDVFLADAAVTRVDIPPGRTVVAQHLQRDRRGLRYAEGGCDVDRQTRVRGHG